MIWEKMKAFGAYAFNKSHAGGYSTIAIKTAWLSYYYPAIFIKANLNVYIENPNKVKLYLADAYKKNIKLLPPSVNKSERFFTVADDNAIRFGLKGIKNVGATSELIINERNARGEFKSYQDFAERLIIHEKMNKNVLESLILAGALDEFEGTRKAKLMVIDKLIASCKVDKKAYDRGQMTIFDLATDLGCEELAQMKVIQLPVVAEFDKKTLLEAEKEKNGYYITEHPLDSYADVLKDENVLPLYELVGADEDDEMDDSMMTISYNNKKVKVAGVIRDMKMLYTKNGKPYKAFVLEDTTGEIECKLFNLEKNSELIQDGERVIMTGKFQDNEYGVSILTETVSDLTVKGTLSKEITVISNTDVMTARKQWQQLLAFAKRNTGNVTIKFLQNGAKYEFPVTIALNTATLNTIQNIFGENNCQLAS